MASANVSKSRQDAIDRAMKVLSERYPKEYNHVMSDPENKKKIHKEAAKHVDELMQTIKNVREEKNISMDALSHLSEVRKQKFKSCLEMKTYEMKIRKTDGVSQVEVTRGDTQFRPTMNLSTVHDVQSASTLQVASIVIESIILVLEVFGAAIPDDEEEIQKVIQIAVEALGKSDTLANDVAKIKKAQEEGDTLGMAKAIFTLVIDAFEEGIFWDVTKALLSDMPWYDWILTSAKIAAEIAALVATGGIAEIALLVSELVDAAFFIQKLVNLSSFEGMKANLTK